MPLDKSIEGFQYPELELDYSDRDSILYALGVGAGEVDEELRFVYEKGVETLPTQPVIAPFPLLLRMEELLGIDQEKVLHGEQRLRIHSPMPPSGRATVKADVPNIWDKGAGAIIDTRAHVSVDGTAVATTTFSSFVRGAGGFGGERGSGLARPEVDGDPEHTISQSTSLQQAQLYRLSGDLNPLHVDPESAARSGFDRPILHGLCSYGFATRMAMRVLLDGPSRRITGVDCRFVNSVYPGDQLRLDVWRTGDGSAYARLIAANRDVVAIDPLIITFE